MNKPMFTPLQTAILTVLLKTPMAAQHVAELLNRNVSTVKNNVDYLRRNGHLYVKEWKAAPWGGITAIVAVGSKEDAPRPEKGVLKRPPMPKRKRPKPKPVASTKQQTPFGWLLENVNNLGEHQ